MIDNDDNSVVISKVEQPSPILFIETKNAELKPNKEYKLTV